MGIDKGLFDIGKYRYKRFGGASWLRIFYHNIKLGGTFANEEEAKSIHETYKYSILGEIKDDEKYKYNGKYEFLIQFSERKGFNWWRQTNFPLNEEDNDAIKKSVEGYENVSVSWMDND